MDAPPRAPWSSWRRWRPGSSPNGTCGARCAPSRPITPAALDGAELDGLSAAGRAIRAFMSTRSVRQRGEPATQGEPSAVCSAGGAAEDDGDPLVVAHLGPDGQKASQAGGAGGADRRCRWWRRPARGPPRSPPRVPRRPIRRCRRWRRGRPASRRSRRRGSRRPRSAARPPTATCTRSQCRPARGPPSSWAFFQARASGAQPCGLDRVQARMEPGVGEPPAHARRQRSPAHLDEHAVELGADHVRSSPSRACGRRPERARSPGPGRRRARRRRPRPPGIGARRGRRAGRRRWRGQTVTTRPQPAGARRPPTHRPTAGRTPRAHRWSAAASVAAARAALPHEAIASRRFPAADGRAPRRP